VNWALMDDRNASDYLQALSEARTPMGQHAYGYAQALAECAHEEPLRIVAYEGERPVGALAAMLYTSGPVPLVESLPFGYGGAFSSLEGEAHRQCVGLLCEALLTVSENAGACLVTIQTPPFPDGPALYRKAFSPDFELRSFCQYVDLVRDFAVPSSGADGKYGAYRGCLRRNHRRNVKLAEEAGLTAGCESGRRAVEQYCALQARRMTELGARPRPEPFVAGLDHHLGPEAAGWFFFVWDGAEAISGTPLIGVRDVLDVILICMDSRASHMQPNALLCYRAMEWAADRGFRWFNFQSSLRRGDSLYHWKTGWGAQEAPVSILTRVVGDIEPILRLSLEELREAYTYHYVLPYPVLEAAHAGRPIDSPGLRVLEKGA